MQYTDYDHEGSYIKLIVCHSRATVKDGNGNGNGNWKWKLETELETGNGRQIFMLQPGVSTLHV